MYELGREILRPQPWARLGNRVPGARSRSLLNRSSVAKEPSSEEPSSEASPCAVLGSGGAFGCPVAGVAQSAAACAALCSVSAAMIEAAVAKLARSSGVYPGRYSLRGCWTCGVMKGV